MNYLSLFSGVGGGDLGLQHFNGMKCKGYVEYDDYCQMVLAQRIKDGMLCDAPIFGDIKAFIDQGFSGTYKGMVDVVTAGFPCQPFSNAGKQQAEKDPRNKWPETRTAISIVRPDHVLLENVPGIRKYLPVVIRDLRRLGYTVKRPRVVAAAHLGAGHIRRRIWIYAYSDQARQAYAPWKSTSKTSKRKRKTSGMADGNEIPSNAPTLRKLQQERIVQNVREWACDCSWWKVEPDVVRVVYGIPNGMDRIGALGNAQPPIMAATAWRILAEDQ